MCTPGLGSPSSSPASAVPTEFLVFITECHRNPKLAWDPVVRALPKGYSHSDLSMWGGEGDAGGQRCPEDG